MSKINKYGHITCGELMGKLDDLSNQFSALLEGLEPLEIRAAQLVMLSNIGFKAATAVLRIQFDDSKQELAEKQDEEYFDEQC